MKVSGLFCPTAEGRSIPFGDVEKALMWLFFQRGGSAVSVLPSLFVFSLGIIFSDHSGIILTPI